MDPYDDYGYGGANPPRDYYAYPEHTEGHRRARGRTEVYGTLRQDVQGRDTEAPYIERLGDKTRVITQSQKYAPTVQPAGVVVSPHLEYAAPPIPGLPVNGFPNAYADEDRRGPQRQSRTQSRFNRTLPAYQTAYQTQPHVPVINNAVPEWPGYDYDSLHEDSVSDAGSDISFTFDLSSHKTGSKGAEHRETVSGSPDKKESGGSTTTNGNQHSPFHESVYRVLRSRYTGDIYARGDTIAELITEHNLGSSKRSQLPLLRWM